MSYAVQRPVRPVLRRVGATAAALVLAGALGACSGSTPTSGMPGMDGTSMPSTSGTPSSSTAPAAAGAADVMFVQMMLPHHEQAVTMSDTLLSKTGVDPEVITLATQIKAAQQPEITTMTAWLTAWGVPTDGGMGGMDGMDHGADDGMLSSDELQALTDAGGPAGQILYLDGMIGHHEGAVSMAQTEVDEGKDADAVALARTIIRTQTDEIATMRVIKDRLT